MPAHAGIQTARGGSLDHRFRAGDKVETVMPAHAGIQRRLTSRRRLWTPAFAGVTLSR